MYNKDYTSSKILFAKNVNGDFDWSAVVTTPFVAATTLNY